VRREGPGIGIGGVGVGPEEGHLLMPRFFKKKGPTTSCVSKEEKREKRGVMRGCWMVHCRGVDQGFKHKSVWRGFCYGLESFEFFQNKMKGRW
jgi:hypothetical protein